MMAYYEAPPPEPEELMKATATFIAAAYRLRVTVTVDRPSGETETFVIDRLPRARGEA